MTLAPTYIDTCVRTQEAIPVLAVSVYSGKIMDYVIEITPRRQ
ncbi:MAG TPA: hypothetical protein VK463_11310 [Desulfomonilaceae bacterium]|nr:hypothetical protein [Desulfomonilaceae bacterium]